VCSTSTRILPTIEKITSERVKQPTRAYFVLRRCLDTKFHARRSLSKRPLSLPPTLSLNSADTKTNIACSNTASEEREVQKDKRASAGNRYKDQIRLCFQDVDTSIGLTTRDPSNSNGNDGFYHYTICRRRALSDDVSFRLQRRFGRKLANAHSARMSDPRSSGGRDLYGPRRHVAGFREWPPRNLIIQEQSIHGLQRSD
jgi:hypothetical protein